MPENMQVECVFLHRMN